MSVALCEKPAADQLDLLWLWLSPSLQNRVQSASKDRRLHTKSITTLSPSSRHQAIKKALRKINASKIFVTLLDALITDTRRSKQ
jgi:hypothetical protein